MQRRCWTLLLLALLAGASGCASTTRRDDGSAIFGPRAWTAPPAPPQRPVTLAEDRSAPATDPAPRREGLSKYFPHLFKTAPETPTLAAESKPRPTWFGLRPPKPAGTQTYMTDTREHLNQPGAMPTSLPVALQVPTYGVTSDRMVTPTSGAALTQGSSQPTSSDSNPPTKPAEVVVMATSTTSAPNDLGGKPSTAGEDEANPLSPASDSGTPAAALNRMPQLPSVDPLASPPEDRPTAVLASAGDSNSDDQALKTSSPTADSAPPVAPPAQKQPDAQVIETSHVMTSAQRVFASPQGPPPKPSPQVKPSSQAKPSPQGAIATGHHWNRPCLRRFVRKVCKLGEFADPPTAAAH